MPKSAPVENHSLVLCFVWVGVEGVVSMERSGCCSPQESLQKLQSLEPDLPELVVTMRILATGSDSTYYVPGTLDLRLTPE